LLVNVVVGVFLKNSACAVGLLLHMRGRFTVGLSYNKTNSVNQRNGRTAMTNFVPFALEHYQSLHERNVAYNLADSSVKCVTTREWLNEDEIESLLDTGLFYPEVNGTTALRGGIADLYTGATAANVLVTVGASQANSMVCQTLLAPGDEVVVMTPGYRQIWGTAQNMGCVVRDLPLRADAGWRIDLDALDQVVTPRTKLVAIVNPNNPTGTIMTRTEMERVVAACARVGAWLHVDEVYHGTEHPGVADTPTFWGMYDRVICTNSFSKAYGLSGLRVGWAMTTPAMAEELWRRHEYAVIAAAAPSMTLAEIALKPAKRLQLLQRQRQITQAGLAVLHEWLATQAGVFSVQPAQATSIAFVRYHREMLSYDVAEAIRQQVSVLVAPGSTLGAEGHLRITVGYEADKVRTALTKIGQVVAGLR
jgi:aspartate/methionine/tyrosine aminotransferase